MRLTIGRKIALALSAVVSLGLLAMFLIYEGLGRMEGAMRDLAEKKEPASAATYEMEIQLHAIGLAILRYLDSGDPGVREQVSTGDAQFAKFHDRYQQLVTTREERNLAHRIQTDYARFKEQGDQLLAAKDAQEESYTTIVRNFERMDQALEASLVRTPLAPKALSRWWSEPPVADSVLRMKAEMAEVGLWLANYHRVPSAKHRDLMFKKQRNVREALRRLRAIASSPDQRHWVAVLEGLFADTTRLIEEVLAKDGLLRQRASDFIRNRDEIDRLLDAEIQARAVQALAGPGQVADEAARAVRGRIPPLMLIFLALAIGVTLLLGRAVTRPVKALAEGAARVGHGDLTHCIPSASRDELADLTYAFNRMVKRLQATTVSKDRLQESERTLQVAVGKLRREIDERSRAKRERTELEVSLRRAETMSIMGALVAGVSHEVRNPLFGISSVLDAMEARHDTTPDSRRYLVVLREQVDRLTRLMQELLDYGKPYNQDLSPGSLGEVIEEATRVYGSHPKAGDVRIVYDVAAGLPLVLMDRSRLACAIANLIENAIHHSPPAGVVTVEARPVTTRERPWVEIGVSDRGPGVPTEDLPRIFDPFFTRRRGGTGLGLSIVQRTVEEHGGVISAGNRPGGGAIVTVHLPVAPTPAIADARIM